MKVISQTVVVAEWKFDLCAKRPLPDLLKLTIAFLGIPFVCPNLSSTVHCFNHEKIFEITAATKRLLEFFAKDGNGVTLVANFTHEAGRSCFEFKNKVQKL